MKSIITVIAIISFIFACTPKLANQPAPIINREATDKKGNLILLGKCTRERLTQAPFDSWFNKNYDAYTVDSNTADQLKRLLKHKQFLLFMGTWCGDSRREVPRIYKILDYCHIQTSQLQLITLNNSDTAYKQSPEHEEKGLNIKRVPTLLVFENHRELERIVESPVVSLEKDLLAIVTAQPYEHHYKSVPNPQPVTASDTTRLRRPTGNN